MIPADVTSQQAVADAAAAAIDQLGHVDVVVNNAGGSNFMVGFRDLRLSGWDKLMLLNLNSAVYVCHAFAGHLLERRQGSVINVASVAGVAASPFLSPYGAAKAGLISLTKSLAVEWGAEGVRVNALCPGWTATDLNRNLWEDADGGARDDRQRADAALGQRRGDGGPGHLPGQRRLVVHDRPGPGRRRGSDRQHLARPPGPRNAEGPLPPPAGGPFSEIYLARAGGSCYSSHHSSASLLADLALPGCLAPAPSGWPAACWPPGVLAGGLRARPTWSP